MAANTAARPSSAARLPPLCCSSLGGAATCTRFGSAGEEEAAAAGLRPTTLVLTPAMARAACVQEFGWLELETTRTWCGDGLLVLCVGLGIFGFGRENVVGVVGVWIG